MTNTLRPGLPQGGTEGTNDFDEFLVKYSGEVLSAFSKMLTLRGVTMEETISAAKAVRFPVVGRMLPVQWSVGKNLLNNSSNQGGELKQKIANSHKDIYPDAKFLTPYEMDEIDFLMAEDAAARRQALATTQAEGLNCLYELSLMSMLAQTAASTDTITNSGTPTGWVDLKAEAAAKAGLTDTSNNTYGYHIDSLADGRAIYAAIKKLYNYAEFLNWPREGRYLLIGTSYLAELVDAAGVNVSFANPSGGTAYRSVPIFDKNMAGQAGGSISNVVVPPIWGFNIIPTRWLTGSASYGLGTSLQRYMTQSTSGSYSPANNTEKKYLPSDGTAGASVGGGVQLKQVSHIPDTWPENQNAMDKIGIIAFHKSAVGTVHLQRITTEMNWHDETQSYLSIAKYCCGHGILRPEAAAYVATDYATVA